MYFKKYQKYKKLYMDLKIGGYSNKFKLEDEEDEIKKLELD
jgi:hypothetical protein